MAQITTLLPTFQRAHLLEEAIGSVRNQTYSDWVLYIFDNNSTDATEEVGRRLHEEDKRIYYIKRETNVGLFNNFALALKAVKTPFFHFFSDDDLIYPWFYETALQGFERHPEAGLSACRTITQDLNNNIPSSQFAKKKKYHGFFHNPEGAKVVMEFPIWTSFLFRNEVLKKVPSLNPHVGTCFDLEFTLRVASKFPIILNPTPAAIFRKWERSYSFDISKDPPNYQYLAECLVKELDSHSPIGKDLLSQLEKFKNTALRTAWVTLFLKKKNQKLRDFLSILENQQALSDFMILNRYLLIQCKIPTSVFFLRSALLFAITIRKFKRTAQGYMEKRKVIKTINSLKREYSGLTRKK